MKRAGRRYMGKKKQSKAAKEALQKLDEFLKAAEAEPVTFLAGLWSDQQNAITYKELRAAVVSGALNEKTLRAWEQDYAKLVNEKLAPVWQKAMQAASDALSAKYPGYFYDITAPSVQRWIAEHGAELVTEIGQQQRGAIAAMLARGASGWGPDELARAIRPCIGLTKPQAMANLNYYQHVKQSLLENNPAMRQSTAETRAREAAAKYAERQHRGRARTIANNELATAYNRGAYEGVRQAQAQGYMGKVIARLSTAGPDACPICAALEGTVVELDRIPPLHVGCRCAVLYEETEPPAFSPKAPPDIPEWVPEQEPQEPSAPHIPEPLPMPEGMRYQGKADLGGTGEMHRYVDTAGNEWLFKPAQSKGGTAEPFRAYVQEAAYRVQNLVDEGTAVPVGVGELGGKFGAFEPRIRTLDDALDLKVWQKSGGALPARTVTELQREHVTDWLLANFDAHGGNFVTNQSGRIIGIDKEQAFKYISQSEARTMSYAYHPNAKYDELEPVYNALFRSFAEGKADMNLQDTLAYIKRVEAVPDGAYRAIFTQYAVALRGAGPEAEALLDAIVERKQALRETYRTFYSDLLTVRTGKKQGFAFADESQEKQPLAAVLMTPEVLAKMSAAELRQLARQKRIPYYGAMRRAELIAALSDPVKAKEIIAAVRERQKAALAAKIIRPPHTRTVYRIEDVLSDLSILPEKQYGVAVRSDSGKVEGLNLAARRMNIDGDTVFELSGKLSRDVWSGLWDKMKPDTSVAPMLFERAAGNRMLYLAGDNINPDCVVKCRSYRDGNASLELFVNGSSTLSGWQGFFRVRVKADAGGSVDSAELRGILERAGLADLMQSPKASDEENLIKARLIWQHAPGRVREFSSLPESQKSGIINKILREEKLTARLERVKLQTVFDGYDTPVDVGALAEYKKAGLKYVWCGVGSRQSIVSILKSPGLTSTNARLQAGIPPGGKSPDEDMESGGSDSVFTRIGVNGAGKRFSDCYAGGGYRIIVDPAVMERTDWYAYKDDSYGRATEDFLSGRLPATEFIRQMAHGYRTGNEIMFRRGIPKERFIGITCDNEGRRAAMLEELRNAGFQEINGTPIEQFVRVEEYI